MASTYGRKGWMVWFTDLPFISSARRFYRHVRSASSSFADKEFTVVSSPIDLSPRSEDHTRPYATILHWGRRLPATMEDVHVLFAPAERELSECRRAVLRLARAAGKALMAGKVEHALINEAEIALARAGAAAALAASILDRIAFEHEHADRHWLGFVEKFHDAESEIADALMGMRYVLDEAEGVL